MQAWAEEADIDGFNLGVVLKPGTMADIVEHVVPEMPRRGLYKTEYQPGTLREKLFGIAAKTPTSHPSAGARPLNADSQSE